MKSHLKLVPVRDMSDEDWLRYRKQGIGASEVGTIAGLNQYKASIELFYEKLGEDLGYNVETIAQFMGLEQEDFIARLWQYWDPSQPSSAVMMQNYRQKKIVRRSQRLNAYVHNPRYPWLFVSLDRKINKGKGGKEGSLELKTIAGYETEKWEGGIPPPHVVQVQTQLVVCEFDFGELATLKDGREFEVIPFEWRQSTVDMILEITKNFWDRVEKARSVVTRKFEAQRNFNYREVEACEQELATLEPPPDNSDAYAAYLKKKYAIAEPGEVIGNEEQFGLAVQHANLSGSIKTLQEQKQGFENQLKNSIRSGADKVTFGDRGYISWKNDVNGVRRFLNKVQTPK